MLNAKKIFKESMGRNPKININYDQILLKGIEESIKTIQSQGYSEGILEDVGKLLKKHGANTMLTIVVLNFFRKIFGRNSINKQEKLKIKASSSRTKQGYPVRTFFLYDDNRLVYSSPHKDVIEEKKRVLEEELEIKGQKKLKDFEEKKMKIKQDIKREGYILFDGENKQVEFSPTGKKAFDDDGNEYILQDGEWVINKIQFEENLSEFDEKRMKDFVDKRYPNVDEDYKLKMFNILKSRMKAKREDHLERGEFPMDEFHKGLTKEMQEHPDLDPLSAAKLVLDHLAEEEYYYSKEEGRKENLKENKGQWWENQDNVFELADKLNEEGYFAKTEDVIYFFEKPYKYEEEYYKFFGEEESYQESLPAVLKALKSANQIMTALYIISQETNRLGDMGDKVKDEVKEFKDKVAGWIKEFKKKDNDKSTAKEHFARLMESLKEQEQDEEKPLSNEEVWYKRIATTDAEDTPELHDIMKVLHRNNKLSTMRMEELKDQNGQEIKDALMDLLSDTEESINTTSAGSLVGQKMAGEKEGKLLDTIKNKGFRIEIRAIPEGFKAKLTKDNKSISLTGKTEKELYTKMEKMHYLCD